MKFDLQNSEGINAASLKYEKIIVVLDVQVMFTKLQATYRSSRD